MDGARKTFGPVCTEFAPGLNWTWLGDLSTPRPERAGGLGAVRAAGRRAGAEQRSAQARTRGRVPAGSVLGLERMEVLLHEP